MDINQFILKLNHLAEYILEPNRKKNLTPFFFPRQINNPIEEQNDLLLTFIYNYDVSNFRIGAFNLHDADQIEYNEQYIFIGTWEIDELVIDRTDNKVKIIDYELSKIISIAVNSEKFLSNLIEIEKSILLRESDEKKIILINNIIDYKESLSFYLTWIGYGN